MRKLWRTRLDGTPRYGNGVVPAALAKKVDAQRQREKRASEQITRPNEMMRYGNGAVPKAATHRSRQTNGKRRYNKGSSAARRIDDLMRDLMHGLDPTEAALGIARSAALAAVRIERLEVREVKGDAIDDERLVRLMGAHSRAVAALNSMRQAQTSPHVRSPEASLGPQVALWTHLHRAHGATIPEHLRGLIEERDPGTDPSKG
jgi:hypothetical protein